MYHIWIPLDINLLVPELCVHLQEDLCFEVCVSTTVTAQSEYILTDRKFALKLQKQISVKIFYDDLWSYNIN